MEIALEELQNTIDIATEYLGRPEKSAPFVSFHIKALQEDMELITSIESPLVDLQTRALDLRIQARRLKRRLEHHLLELDRTRPSATTDSPIVTIEPKLKSMNLPPLKIPTFDGDGTQFLVFWNVLVENVINNAEMTSTAKWIHLKNSLTGAPAELISEIPQTPEMLNVALKLLDDIYGGEEKTITELYHKFHTLPTATTQTESIRMTHAKLEGILLSLVHLGHEVNNNQYIRSVYIGKFPSPVLNEVIKTKNTPLQTIRDDIGQLLMARESTAKQTLSVTSPPIAPPQQPRTNATTRIKPSPTESPMEPPKCLFCTVRHWPDQCQTYDTAEKRREKAKDRCLKCIRPLHPGKDCIRPRRCCHCDSMQHNRAFCPVRFPNEPVTEKVLAIHDRSPQWVAKRGCFLTCVTPVSSKTAPTPQQFRILIDTAGSRTMITKAAAKKLHLRPTNRVFTFSGIEDGEPERAPAIHAPITFHTLDGSTVEIGAYITDELATNVAVPDVEKFKQKHAQYKDLYIPNTGKSLPIDILIGGDNLLDFVFFDRGCVVDPEHQLMATKLGWLIVTRQQTNENQTEPVLLLTDDEHIKTMFDLEVIGLADIQKSDYEEEQAAIDQFYKTIERVGDRYDVGWPYKEKTPEVSVNYGLALGCLKSLWKRLRHQHQLLLDYHNIIVQQESDEIVEKVMARTSKNPTHYISHHPIITPGKSTSTRIVYNASGKTSPTEKSLNETMLKGKKWLQDMSQIIMRFRTFPTAVTSDIAKAFHQIGIREQDRDVLRFLWLKNPLQPPSPENIQIYRFRRVAFGVIASPFLLDATISFHLQQQEPSRIVDIVGRDLYADNIVTALPADIDASTFYTTTKEIFRTMSMNITKWASNNTQLMERIPASDRVDEKIQNVLGLTWDRINDTLSIKKPKEQRDTLIPTKRNILRKTASIFDPLGWASPIILLAKLLLRKLWDTETKWDEEIHLQLQEEWEDITQHLNEVEKIKLPRQMLPIQNDATDNTYTLHAFVDASALAFAVVVYIIHPKNGSTYSAFVASKSRLAPRKKITIPKLELLAVHIGARYINFVQQALQLNGEFRKIVWSDSKCVLSWVASQKMLPAVIQKQITEIKKQKVDEYRYVPSMDNRADVATRGMAFEQLQEMDWWQAPRWLLQQNSWPLNEIASTTEHEIQLLVNEAAQIKKPPNLLPNDQTIGVFKLNINNFSSLHRLLMVTAFVIKAAQRLGKKKTPKLAEIDAYECGKTLWLKWDQQRNHLHSKDKAGRLTTFSVHTGLIRCNTRIPLINHQEMATPIWLPNGSRLTQLLILHIHHYNCHAGTSYILATLQKKYYLQRARREIYRAIKTLCFQCRRHTATEYDVPVPAPLPAFRVDKSATPFESIGMDVFGPFNVRLHETNKTPKQKRWVVIFTCATIRAIHLEVIEDMTTKELLWAFRRFAARRGVPARILCDNAPQFGALDHKFQDIWKTFSASEQATAYFAPNQIKWQFTPQHSPWMGGMYERLIRSVKQAFDKTYGRLSLHARQFETSVIEIEAIINARPLSYIENDPNAPILTPAHFLQTRYPAIPIETRIEEHEDLMTKLWKSSQQYIAEFWQHWSEMYVTQLRNRHDTLRTKNKLPTKNPEKGDLVLLADPDRKRVQWRMALVERLVTSNDGVIRSAQIKMPNGSRTIRPIVKLAPLGITADLPNIENNQLNLQRNAIFLQAPEGAAQEQQQIAEQNEETEEIITLGLEDIEEEAE